MRLLVLLIALVGFSAAVYIAAIRLDDAGYTVAYEDSPYMPTPPRVVSMMLQVADVGPGDVVFDLGCGDGRIVIEAAMAHGANGVCVEYDQKLVERAAKLIDSARVTDKVQLLHADLFTVDLSRATVVTLFLVPEMNARLLPKMQKELRPGTRVVSHWHVIPGWLPDRVEHVTAYGRTRPVYSWVVK